MTIKLVMDGAPDRFGLVEENAQRQRQMQRQKQMRGFFPFDKLRVRMTNQRDVRRDKRKGPA
jgi:hypothetical protein